MELSLIFAKICTKGLEQTYLLKIDLKEKHMLNLNLNAKAKL